MNRRDVMKFAAATTAAIATPESGWATGGAGKSNCIQAAGNDEQIADAAFYLPGYWPDSAFVDGVPATGNKHFARAIPKDYRGNYQILTRLGMDGSLTQALFPVRGHDVDVSPDGRLGFFGSMERDNYVCFDPHTLDLVSIGKPFAKGWIGGGHGTYLQDGKLLAVSERAPKKPYTGKADQHYGRITLRDPETLKIVESYSTHGVSPHDICLLDDGRHLAIANYGSVVPKKGKEYGIPRHVVEPSVTVIDLRDGKLVAKRTTEPGNTELRHLTARDVDRIFAIQVKLGKPGEEQKFLQDQHYAYEADFSAQDGESYLPAPVIALLGKQPAFSELGDEKLRRHMRHGLSIRYDADHGEVLATFPSTHSLMVIDDDTGEIRQRIDTAALGLDYPCGLSLIPDSPFYAVSGYWKNLFIFRRGTHEPVRELCHYASFFGHSHMTAVRTG